MASSPTAFAPVAAWLQSLPVWEALVVLVVLSLVAAWLVAVVSTRIGKRLVAFTDTEFDDLLFDELRLPVTVTVGLTGVYLAGNWLVLSSDPAVNFALRAATLTVILLVWARTLVRLGDRVIRLVDETSEVAGFAPIFQNLWSFGILIGALFLVLSVWRVDVTPLLASAGIAGIAVGFAAKDTVANFFGSIALYVDNTYKVGDYVVLDSGEHGTVIDISIRSTRIITRDNVVVTVPNSVLNSARIVNRSAPRPHTRVRVPVGVAYGSDIDEVEALLLDAAAEEDLVVESPPPRVRFRGFGDSALDYELLAYVGNPLEDARAVHKLNRAIYTRFGEHGVEIPFPQRVVTVDGASATDGFVETNGEGGAVGAASGDTVEADEMNGETVEADEMNGETAETGETVGDADGVGGTVE